MGGGGCADGSALGNGVLRNGRPHRAVVGRQNRFFLALFAQEATGICGCGGHRGSSRSYTSVTPA